MIGNQSQLLARDIRFGNMPEEGGGENGFSSNG
jgi:hypothetical protein